MKMVMRMPYGRELCLKRRKQKFPVSSDSPADRVVQRIHAKGFACVYGKLVSEDMRRRTQ